jgi:hypothetical protein
MWPNRDPLGDSGFITMRPSQAVPQPDIGELLTGPNSYEFVRNDPIVKGVVP